MFSSIDLLEQWCVDRAAAGQKILGLCAPPGSGKSWLASQLQIRLSVASLSLDDLYWPQPQLQQYQRGLPGSHDLPLLKQVLADFRQHGKAMAPCFVKGLAAGAGDRQGQRPLVGDLLLLEGWCVGARGLPTLQPYQAIWQQLDGLLLLRPPSYGRVMRWRLQAEAKQRQQGGGCLNSQAGGSHGAGFLWPSTCGKMFCTVVATTPITNLAATAQPPKATAWAN